MRVAVIGRNRTLCEDIKCELEKRKYEIDIKINGDINDLLSPEDNYDVIVLDIDSGGEHGIRLCRELRANGVYTPVIMLMYRNSGNSVVAGFEAGADDFLSKPINRVEFSARIKSLIKISSLYRKLDSAEPPLAKFRVIRQRTFDLASVHSRQCLSNQRLSRREKDPIMPFMGSLCTVSCSWLLLCQ